MPYLDRETVKRIRTDIKKRFPDYKFRVRKENNMAVHVEIMEGPKPLTEEPRGYETVNHFYIEEHYRDRPEVRDLLMELKDIMNRDNGTETWDGDYGHIPLYYIHLSIGRWDQPYKVRVK